MTHKKTLYILDSLALIYRAHFALYQHTHTNSKGVAIGALLGFANSLVEMIQKRKPTHIIATFDTKKGSWRKEEYPLYKAHREVQPEAITTAIPYSKQLLEAFGIPCVEKEGYEADDVIGTLALQAATTDFEVYIVSPDKDLGQLVQKNIWLYKPSSGQKPAMVWGEKEVLDYWGISKVSLIPDMLGLCGDSSDNIPGVPKIGIKTAQKLMNSFGSLEEILACDKMGKGLADRLQTHQEQALLSKKLATISTDVDLNFHFENSLYKGFDKKLLDEFLQELEFNSLRKRLFGNVPRQQLSLFAKHNIRPHNTEVVTDNLQRYEASQVLYSCVKEKDAIVDLVATIKKQQAFCFDTETSGLDPYHSDLLGIALSYESGKAYYVPMPSNFEACREQLKVFAPIFANITQRKIGQNMKFDMLVLQRYGMQIAGPFFDTMIAHHLLVPYSRHNLTVLANQYLAYDPIPIETLIGKKGSTQLSMRDVALEKIVVYACEDADITWRVYEKEAPKLREEGMDKIFYDLEMQLLPVLVKMELAGIAIDTDMLHEISGELGEQINVLEEGIYTDAGCTFNVASPKQLGDILFHRLKIENKPTKTAKGQFATNEAILKKLVGKHPIVKKVLSYRELCKLKSTYVDALPMLLGKDERLHTSFQQGFVSTGRLSSTKPNLQNIPIRTERGREIRKAFVAQEQDHMLMSADYSQVELRMIAHFAKDQSMIKAFEEKKDIHTIMGAHIFKCSEEKVTPEMRRVAKATNFGLIYGISPFGLSQGLGISRTEAANLIKTYFEEFPAIQQYMTQVVEGARAKGYVATLLGRKRFLPDINSQNATVRGMAERNAINMPIQGSAAELIQCAMIDVDSWLQKTQLPAKMILQVHDELIFEVHKSAVDALSENIPSLMIHALPLDVPLEVSIGVGKNWLEAH